MTADHTAPRRTLIRCGTLLTMADNALDGQSAEILMVDGRIAEIGQTLKVADALTIDAADMIVMPGFVDTHRHTWQTCLRHRSVDIHPPELYFTEMMTVRGPRYRPEDVWIGNYLGALGALDSGVTTMLDWSQVQNTPDHSDAAIDALQATGIRSVFAHGWSLTDPAYRRSGSIRLHPRDIIRLRRDRLASDDGLVTLAMAARGPEIASPQTWQADLALARELGIRSSIHMGAYPRNGQKRGIAAMHAAGGLGPDLTFIHCNCSGTDEIAMMADHGVTASLGINVEMNSPALGDLPLDRMLAAGIRPSLSGDTETLGSADMFTQMRSAMAYYRSYVGSGHSSAADAPETLTSRDVLQFATVEGARANGLLHRIGTIEVGKEGDLIMLRRSDINLMPVSNPWASVVSGAHAGNVDTVMVAGRVVKQYGKLVGVDLDDVRRRARESQHFILEDRDRQAAAAHGIAQ